MMQEFEVRKLANEVQDELAREQDSGQTTDDDLDKKDQFLAALRLVLSK